MVLFIFATYPQRSIVCQQTIEYLFSPLDEINGPEMTQDPFRPDAWTRACNRFTEDLSEDEKRLYFQATPETIFYEASAVDKISNDSSHTRNFFQKLQPLVDSIEQYGAALDVFANTYPLVMSPLWGSIRIVLHLAREAGQYFERISTMFIDIGELLPHLHVYERLFPRHERLVQALSVIYCDLIQFCSDAKHALRRVKRSSFTLTWKTFDRHFGDQIERFRKHQTLVEKEVNASHMIESADSRSVVLANHMQVSKEHQESEIRRTFAHFSPVDYEAQLHRLYNMHQTGTCTWFKKNPMYREWEQSIFSRGLCCSGIPGCGKSVLIATMVKQQLQKNDDSMLYFFCDYSDPATLLKANVHRALLKQLFDNNLMPETIKRRIVEQCKRSSHGPNIHDLAIILSESIEACHSLQIMIDGLDECSDETQSCLSEQVLGWLNMGTSIVKVIVTCREEEKPLRHLRTCANLKFDVSMLSADIEAFITKSVESCISSGSLTIGCKDLERLIITKLSKKAQGMFLWVHFQLQDLCEATSDQAIRGILDHLPNGLHDTYVRILEKIEGGRSPLNKFQVQQALQWVAFARRPLTLSELREAVAFDSKDDKWEADKIPHGDKLIGLCRGLIIRGQDGKVRFAHHTVRQHLLQPAVQGTSSISPFQVNPDGLSAPHLIDYYFTSIRAEFRLAMICATYLCFSDFESAMVKANKEDFAAMAQILKSGGPMAIPATVGLKRQLSQIPYKFLGGKGGLRMPEIDFSKYGRHIKQQCRAPPEMRDKYALLDYVIQYWPWHTKQWLSKTGLELNMPPDLSDERTDRQLGIARGKLIDVQIGCLPTFQKFWDQVLHKNLSFEIRPWGLNQHFGLYGCQGCPPAESQDHPLHRSRWTSLIHWAAEMGHVPLIQSISTEILDHLYHERYHHQTLNIACANDQSEFISYMFIAGTLDVERLPGGQVVENLQATGQRLGMHQSPYLIADWTELCCQTGALEGLIALMDVGGLSHDNDFTRRIFYRGAFAAASSGRWQVLRRLLEEGINVRAQDSTGMTLLHLAARDGHANVVKQLLQADALLDTQDAQGGTPLILASQGGHTKVVQLLLKAGAKVMIEGGELIPLPCEANIHLLLSGSVTNEDVRRPTAIHIAAANGYHNLLSQLLLSDEESNVRVVSPIVSTLSTMHNESPLMGLDPLECAAVYGHCQCVELLLKNDQGLNAGQGIILNGSFSRALHLAATMGHETVVRILLQTNADPDITIPGGVTPLHLASDSGKTAIIRLLLGSIRWNEWEGSQSHWRVNRRLWSRYPHTPLSLAVVSGHNETVEKLIEYGAELGMEYYSNSDASPINALQLAIRSPKAGFTTMKAVCVRGIPRGVIGSFVELSDQDLLRCAIESSSPEKLQTLFDIGLRDGVDMGPEREESYAEAPDLIRAAISHNQYQCLEILLANCSYVYDSLMVATQFARDRISVKENGSIVRDATKQAEKILEKKLTEMRSARASAEVQSPAPAFSTQFPSHLIEQEPHSSHD